MVELQTIFSHFSNFFFYRNPPINAEDMVLKKGTLLKEPNIELFNPTHGRSIPMMRQKKEWLFTISPVDFIFKMNASIDIQAYTPQFGGQL